jgi:Flp pilus assembly protein TadG
VDFAQVRDNRGWWRKLFPNPLICPEHSLITPQICHSSQASTALGELYFAPGLPRGLLPKGKVMSEAAKTVAKRSLKRFVRKEDGNIATFSILLFALMVMCGGLAVDLMRYEHMRTALQQTLDRCTLAAAALKQTLDRNAVCRDYAAKAGLNIPASSVTVTQGANFAQVQAAATLKQPTIFAGMLGIPEFDVPARSMAMQAITNVEIAMVLDVSRSMILPETKLAGVKTAAKEFVTTVLSADTENRTSIAIVPYNGQVNLGSVLAAKYNVDYFPIVPAAPSSFPSGITCVDLPAAVYSSNTLSRTLSLPQTMYVDAFSQSDTDGNGNPTGRNIWRPDTDSGWANHGAPNVLNRWCPSQPTNIVRLPSNNVTNLHAQIDGLVGIGATSINAGMKWGMAMLDPANRPMFNEFRSAGQIPSYFSGRPYNYTVSGAANPEAMKIIVLMTDGENFPESRINPGFRGMSPIWVSADGIWSIHHPTVQGVPRPTASGTDEYFAPSLCSAPTTNITATVPTSTCDAWRPTKVGTAPHVQMSWARVFENRRMSYIAWQFYGRALGNSDSERRAQYTATLGNMRTQTSQSTMNDQLQDVCDQAQSNNVVVYGIAFEAPAGGKTQIQDCATSSTHYYEASTLNVATAFKSIASRISQLRLTQ